MSQGSSGRRGGIRAQELALVQGGSLFRIAVGGSVGQARGEAGFLQSQTARARPSSLDNAAAGVAAGRLLAVIVKVACQHEAGWRRSEVGKTKMLMGRVPRQADKELAMFYIKVRPNQVRRMKQGPSTPTSRAPQQARGVIVVGDGHFGREEAST